MAKFATYQPAWFKLKAQELKKAKEGLERQFKNLSCAPRALRGTGLSKVDFSA